MRRYSDDYQSNNFLSYKFCQKCGLILSPNEYQNKTNLCFNCFQNQRFSDSFNSRIIYSKTNNFNNLNECLNLNSQYLMPHLSDPSVSSIFSCPSGPSNQSHYLHNYRSSSKFSYAPLINSKVVDWSQLGHFQENVECPPRTADQLHDAETLRQMLDTQTSEVSPYEEEQFSDNNSVIMDISNSDEPKNDARDATPEYEHWLEEALDKSKKVDKIINDLDNSLSKKNLKKKKLKTENTKRWKVDPTSSSQIFPITNKNIRNELLQPQTLTVKKRLRKKNRKSKGEKRTKSCIKFNSSPNSSLNVDHEKETYFDNQSTELNISDLVENGLENVPFEQLVKHYNDIQRQLEELSKEEEKRAEITIDNQKNVNKKSFEEINNQSEEIEENDEVNDDDLIQLRLLALNSKKTNRIHSSQSLEVKENTPAIIIPQSTLQDDDLNEEELRATLLKSIVSKKCCDIIQEPSKSVELKASASITDQNKVNIISNSIKPLAKSKNLIPSFNFIQNLNASIDAQDLILDQPVSKFVINFGDDSSVDDESEENEETQQEKTLSNLESLEAKLKSSQQTEIVDSESTLNSVDRFSKLSLAQKKKFKETNTRNSRALLQLKEAKWKQMKNNISQNKTKLGSLKLKISSKQLNLRNAQIHAKKMHDLYLKATKMVSQITLELNQLNENLKTVNSNLEKDQKLNLSLSKECIKLGLQVEGKAYKLPSQKKELIISKLNGDNEIKIKSNQELAMQKKKLKGLEKAVSKRLYDMQSPSTLKTTNAAMVTNSGKISDELNSKVNETEKSFERRKKFETALKKIISTSFKSSKNSIIYVPFLHSLQYLTYQMSFNTQCSVSFDYESHFNSSEDISNQSSLNLFSSTTFTSGLSHLHAYRLSQCYDLFTQKHLLKPDYLSASYSNAIHPHEVICHYDLMGTCNDDNCTWQHKDSYLLDPIERLVDILTYNPTVSGYSGDNENVEKLREHLKIFVDQFKKAKGCLGEDEIEQIVNLVKKSISAPISAIQRVIPRFEGLKNEENLSIHTFDDFKYNIKIRDRNLVLTYGKIYRIKANVDPDIYIKNRFFAPEGRPISAELETTLASEPHNVNLWLNLAYYHVTRSPSQKADCINRALNVLSRALECNHLNLNNCTKDDWDRNLQLWEHFLLLYANRVLPLNEASDYQLLNICKQAIIFCPDYKVWRQYLSLCVSFKEKNSVSNEFLNAISNNLVHFENETHASNSILELVFYKVQLHLEAGNKIQSHTFLRKYLLNQYKFSNNIFHSPLEVVQSLFENPANSIQTIKCILGSRLTISDRVYAWLCYIHLLYTGSLPFDIFENFSPGYCKISHKRAFSIEWNYSLSTKKKSKLLLVFRSSLQDCLNLSSMFGYEYLTSCLPLVISLANLDSLSTDSLKLYKFLQMQFPKSLCLWILKAEIETRLNYFETAIQTLKESPGYQENNIKILFLISILFYKLNQYQESFLELQKIVSSYFDREIPDSEMKSAFDLLMTESSTLDHPLRSFLKCKIIEKTNILNLCYFLFQLMTINSNQDMEYLFNSSLNLCKLRSENDNEIQFYSFWCLYIYYFLQNIADRKEYKETVICLRHCCLSMNNHFFQVKFIKYFAQSLSNQMQQFNFMIDFVKLLPENMLLLTETIELGLNLDEREKCYDLFKYFFINKRYKNFEANHWKSIICLAIDCKDNLNAHRYFQLALSNNPYNCGLWKLMLTYETSLNHENHIKEAKKVLSKLELPLTSSQR